MLLPQPLLALTQLLSLLLLSVLLLLFFVAAAAVVVAIVAAVAVVLAVATKFYNFGVKLNSLLQQTHQYKFDFNYVQL